MATVETRGVKKYYGDVAAVNGVDLPPKMASFSCSSAPRVAARLRCSA